MVRGELSIQLSSVLPTVRGFDKEQVVCRRLVGAVLCVQSATWLVVELVTEVIEERRRTVGGASVGER